MNEPQVFSMSITPFTPSGGLDEDGLRDHLGRMVDSGVGVYLASPGTGEGHALSEAELERVYRIGVEVCGGLVPTYANLREGRNAADVIARAKIAESAGVDLIQIYTVDAGHGMRPTTEEQEAYYRDVLAEVSTPVGLSVNILAAGYVNPVPLLERLVRDHPQIECINVNHPPTSFLAELIDAVGRRVRYYVDAPMLPEALTLGASGCLTGHVNVVPQLIRAIGRLFVAGEHEKCGEALRLLFKLSRTVSEFRAPQTSTWSGRWVKAAMAVLGMPGHGAGRMRPPYLSPTPEDLKALAAALTPLDLLDVEAAAAGWAS